MLLSTLSACVKHVQLLLLHAENSHPSRGGSLQHNGKACVYVPSRHWRFEYGLGWRGVCVEGDALVLAIGISTGSCGTTAQVWALAPLLGRPQLDGLAT